MRSCTNSKENEQRYVQIYETLFVHAAEFSCSWKRVARDTVHAFGGEHTFTRKSSTVRNAACAHCSTLVRFYETFGAVYVSLSIAQNSTGETDQRVTVVFSSFPSFIKPNKYGAYAHALPYKCIWLLNSQFRNEESLP